MCAFVVSVVVVDQVFVGAYSVGFFSDLYYQGTNVASRLHCFFPSLYEFLGGIEGVMCIHPNKFYLARRNMLILVMF